MDMNSIRNGAVKTCKKLTVAVLEIFSCITDHEFSSDMMSSFFHRGADSHT